MAAILGCSAATAAIGFVFLTAPEGESFWNGLAWVVLALAGIQAVGAALVAVGRRRLGAVLAFAGAVPLVPLGLLGAWGARGILDDLAREDLERRRREATRG